MSSSNININSILGIKNSGKDRNLFDKLGFRFIQDIIISCGFEPIIIDLTISRKTKWSAVAFKNGEGPDNYLPAYISALKYMLIDKCRPLFNHPDFTKKRDIIICQKTSEPTKDKPPILSTVAKKSSKITEDIHLYKYMDTVIKLPGSTNNDNSPEENAAFLFSLFHFLNKCHTCHNDKKNNCFFVAIPITRVKNITWDESHDDEKREVIGGAFIIVKGKYDEDNIKLMCLRIISVFLKGLVDWKKMEDTIENCGVEKWLKLREDFSSYLESSEVEPHHFPYGTCENNKGSEDYENKQQEFIDSLIRKGAKYINDIVYCKDFSWYEEDKKDEVKWKPPMPPIRAIAQNDSKARDFSTFMKLLRKDLSSNFTQLDIYFTHPLSNNNADYLWFNPVPLGTAIFNICEGLKELKSEQSKSTIFGNQNKARVDIVYEFKEFSNNNIFLYFNVYEYGGAHEIFFVENCWESSKHSLDSARKNLYISGVRNMFYSGFNKTGKFKTQKITLEEIDLLDRDGLSEVNAKCADYGFSYKKTPPFLSFGITGGKKTNKGNSVVYVLPEEKGNELERFFKEEFVYECNSD